MRDYTKPNKASEVANKNEESVKVSKTEQSNKMKMFVSIPMAGRPEKEVVDEINAIREKFKENYEVIDSFIQDEDPNGVSKYSGVWYLGKSLQMMRTVNLVVFAKGWENARGCIIEHKVCEYYDIPFIEMI